MIGILLGGECFRILWQCCVLICFTWNIVRIACVGIVVGTDSVSILSLVVGTDSVSG